MKQIKEHIIFYKLLKYIKTFLIVFCCFIQFNIFSQQNIIDNRESLFEHISNSEGLMHNSIGEIFQDSRGYIWFGTYNGLYKYDGYEFKIYNNDLGDKTSLIGNKIKVVFEDSKGVLWIGTQNGLCFYDRDNDCFVRQIVKSTSSEKKVFKELSTTLLEDEFFNLWVGTAHGLFILKGTKDDGYVVKEITFTKKHIPTITNIIQDKSKNILIATSKGIYKIKAAANGQVNLKEAPETILESSFINSIFIDTKNVLWVGTNNGLYKKENGKLPVLDSKIDSTYNISEIIQDSNSFLWLSTESKGLIEYNTNQHQIKVHTTIRTNKNSLKSNAVATIYEDNSGIIWVGTTRGGLSKLDTRKNKIAHYNYRFIDKASLSGNVVNTIFEDSKKNLWVATFEKGLNRYEPEINGFINYKANLVGSDNIHAICEDNYGKLWMGTMAEGLIELALDKKNILKTKKYTKENTNANIKADKITVLFKDKLGDIWMGGSAKGGLMKFTPAAGFGKLPKITQYTHSKTNINTLSSDYVFTIYEDSNGILWVGTNRSGLVKVIRDKNNNPTNFIRIVGSEKNLTGLNNNQIFSLHEDKSNNLWVGTFGGGLNLLTKEESKKETPKFLKYKTNQGLSSNEVYGILEDKKNNLWISTNNGISQFNLDTKTFSNLKESDGLQALNFRRGAYYKSKEGILYFGGINGMNAFNPESFHKNLKPPKIEITKFKVFNKDVEVNEEVLGKKILTKKISETQSIELEYNHNSFSFEFAALHFSSPEDNLYKYKLEGFDKNWIETNAKRRYATYSNLKSGEYLFKVKASNNDNVWADTSKDLKIKVLPPFWRTWWANVVYILFGLFLMWLYRRYILKNEEFKNLIKIEQLEQTKIKELNKMRLEFFTNISHEFKTPLTLILGPLQNLLKSEATTPKLKDTFLMMERNANQLFRLINQVMEFRKVEAKEIKVNLSKGNLISFCEEVFNTFKVLAEEKEINLSFNSEVNEIISYFDWDKTEKILNNLVSNAIKYTPKKGNVKINILLLEEPKKANFVKIVVSDSGVGIPKSKREKIFGRFYQVEESGSARAFSTGIGLAYTKSLITLLKGNVEVRSKINKGSKFIVTFPLINNLDTLNSITTDRQVKVIEDKKSPEKENTIEIEENKSIKKPLLLIVEDNIDMQKFLKESLKDSYDIMQAFDGKEGVDLAFEKVPNIILSDVMMPNMDGIEFCNQIKQNEITNHIPIILLTAKTSVEHRIEGIEVGADAYISKPFDMRFLKIKIKKLLEKREFLKVKFTSKGITLDSQKIGVNNTDKAFLEKAENIVENNLMNSAFSVEDLANELNFSRMQLYRKLKTVRGLSANDFIRAYRIKKAALLLRETDLNVSEILYRIGFTNRSYFSKCFKKTFDISPKAYAVKYREEKRKSEED